MPWCEAPIRHIDHVERFADGGRTETGNGVGLCESCNYTVELPGWKKRMIRGDADESGPPSGPGDPTDRVLEITTPGGRVLRSAPPPLRRGTGRRALE